MPVASAFQWLISFVLIASSLGVILAHKPVHACLSFLLTLLALAALYLQLSAEFIAVMQILVYAGAILVIFMFVIILFQDAYIKITHHAAKSPTLPLWLAAAGFIGTSIWLALKQVNISSTVQQLPADYGTVQSLGLLLYTDFFLPFEAVILLFLVAAVGALYIGKKEV
jgi:NADH-quinone oxidoreductase subunit J